VFPKLDIVGWYATGEDVQEADMLIHRKACVPAGSHMHDTHAASTSACCCAFACDYISAPLVKFKAVLCVNVLAVIYENF